MPKVVTEFKNNAYDLVKNKNIRKRRYVVECRLTYPGRVVTHEWHYVGTYYSLSRATRQSHLRRDTIHRVVELAPGEIYREGWDKK